MHKEITQILTKINMKAERMKIKSNSKHEQKL